MKRISVNEIWGLGIYINPRPYRYVALQFGPLWIYVYHQALNKQVRR
jgi:hypothetical protein